MCGFVGGTEPSWDYASALAAIEHRGPDDSGLHLRDPVRVGFRRLSIIDLDTGHQRGAVARTTLGVGDVDRHGRKLWRRHHFGLAVPNVYPAPAKIGCGKTLNLDIDGAGRGHHGRDLHLRGGRVARGGLRHSDRYDDFRTEVLGLMKTQQVKNSIIVPVGAKGGFVVRGLEALSGEARKERSAEQYKTFILAEPDVAPSTRP